MRSSGDPKPSVAIIGGGWAGLSCALRLARAGHRPIVYESAPEVGGRARRAQLDGYDRDNGQHLMLSGCKALTALFAEIGVALPTDAFAYRNTEGGFSLAGRHGRSGLLLGLMGASCFSLSDRLRLLKALITLQWRGWQVPAHETVLQWLLTQQQTPALVHQFWAPLILAVLNTPLEIATMARLVPVLRDTLGTGADALQIVQPPDDLSASIVEPLVAAIQAAGGVVHCGQRITAITQTITNVTAVNNAPRDPQRYEVHIAGTTVPQTFDRVVLAVPPWSLTKLDVPFATADLCLRFGAQPIATVYLGFDARVGLPTPLVQIDGPLPADARVWVMDRAHCGEPGVLAVSLSAEGPWCALTHGDLAAACAARVQAALQITSPCLWQKAVVVHRATYAATLTARLNDGEAEPLPGLWLTGDWTHPHYPATLEAAVASGFDTANRILHSHT